MSIDYKGATDLNAERNADKAAISSLATTKQDLLTSITGYDATKTQVLKNDKGTLKWVDEAAE